MSRVPSIQLPLDKQQKCLVDTIRYSQKRAFDYLMPPGDALLREQISKHYMVYGTEILGDELIITNGCQNAVFLALLAICQPGDTVAIETPTFFNFVRMLESLHLRILEIPCSAEEGMSFEALQFALENHNIKALVSLPNFNNPLGSLMPEEKKKQIVQLLDFYGIPLIEDDVYSDIYFTENRPLTYKAFDKSGGVLLCSSFSKTIAPGLRLGWIAPGRFYERVVALKTLSSVGVSPFPLLAVARFIMQGGFERGLRKLRQTLQQQIKSLRECVLDIFPPGTKVNDPKAGLCCGWNCRSR